MEINIASIGKRRDERVECAPKENSFFFDSIHFSMKKSKSDSEEFEVVQTPQLDQKNAPLLVEKKELKLADKMPELIKDFEVLTADYLKELTVWKKELEDAQRGSDLLTVASYLREDIQEKVLYARKNEWIEHVQSSVNYLQKALENQKEARSKKKKDVIKQNNTESVFHHVCEVEFARGDRVDMKYHAASPIRYTGRIHGVKTDGSVVKVCVHFADGDKRVYTGLEMAQLKPTKLPLKKADMPVKENCTCKNFSF